MKGREGGRVGGEEVLREETHHLCSGGSNISWLQSDSTANSIYYLSLKLLLCDAAMWIYKTILAVFVVSCSGKFGENYLQLLGFAPCRVPLSVSHYKASVCAPCKTDCQT